MTNDDPTQKRKREHSWEIQAATPDDAPRLASLQVSAFRSNPLFQLQFPTAQVVKSYEIYLAARIRSEIATPHSDVVVAKDNDDAGGGGTISFAIWRPPRAKEEKSLDGRKTWPLGTDVDMIVRWAGKVNEAYSVAVGERLCYRELHATPGRCGVGARMCFTNKKCQGLDWLVTEAGYQRRGLGSALLDWGLERARAEGMPVHLESTVEATEFYVKRGFHKVADIRIALHADEGEMYHEVGLLWEP